MSRTRRRRRKADDALSHLRISKSPSELGLWSFAPVGSYFTTRSSLPNPAWLSILCSLGRRLLLDRSAARAQLNPARVGRSTLDRADAPDTRRTITAPCRPFSRAIRPERWFCASLLRVGHSRCCLDAETRRKQLRLACLDRLLGRIITPLKLGHVLLDLFFRPF